MSFAQWINDRRWAANVRRARAFRNRLSFSERRLFDDALRGPTSSGLTISYPDAFYHVTMHNFVRAAKVVLDRRYHLDAYGDLEDH